MFANMRFLELAALIATPKVIGRATTRPTNARMLAVIDDFAATLPFYKAAPMAPGNQAMIATEAHIASFRAMVDAWNVAEPPTDELTQKARTILAAAGIDGPPCGWDEYEGPTQ